MGPPFWLSPLESSIVHVLLVIGAALVIPLVFDRRNSWHRAAMLAIGAILALRYAWWRATETLAPLGLTWDWAASWSLFALEMLTLLSALSAFLIMARIRERSQEATDNARWWAPAPDPRVAVLIATYNEDQEVLERTIIGAKALNYPAKEVLVLDDGRRDWLREFSARHGVRYVRRPDNRHAKAGNINHALALLAQDPCPPDFVAVLDADFVPHRTFLDRTLALFHAPDVGLVQTPQHFFNADPIQHNLGLSRSYPDEQRFFFDHLLPARDGWGIAFCCGTSSVIRMAALQDAGGFPTESVTEDFLLTLALQERGWRTVYLNEPLSEGLAPEGLKEYITQRARWCLGQMQIARSRLGPLGRNNLRLRDRWSVADSVVFWLTTFPFRIAALIYPLLYWFFGLTVVDASVPDVISYFGTYYLWITLTLNVLAPGKLLPIFNDVSQLLGAFPISRAGLVGLFKPKGHPFSVTAKGGDRSRIQVQWSLMRPFVILLVLTLTGLMLGIVFDRFAYDDAGDGKAVILFWTIYNLIVLAVTILACIELPRRERHIADQPERAIFVTDTTGPKRVWLSGLTLDSARVRGRVYPVGEKGIIRIRGVGDIEALVLAQTADGARLHLSPNDAAYEALLRRFYTEGGAPGVTQIRLSALIEDVMRRLSFSRDRG